MDQAGLAEPDRGRRAGEVGGAGSPGAAVSRPTSGSPPTDPSASTRPAAGPGVDPWAAWRQLLTSASAAMEREQQLGQRWSRLFVSPADQARAYSQFVAGLAPPGDELRSLLDRVRDRRRQVEVIGERLDAIEAAATRYLALVDAIEERQREVEALFVPPAWRARPGAPRGTPEAPPPPP